MQGTSGIQSKMAWRTPLIVMMTAPLVLLVLTPLLPETPRKSSTFAAGEYRSIWYIKLNESSTDVGWYITKGRPDDAKISLAKLRGPSWPREEIEKTVHDIEQIYKLEAELEGSSSYLDCLRGIDARRTRLVLLVITGQAFTGISFITG